jgi:hypothetical protein
MSKTLEEACQAAAIEDGVLTPGEGRPTKETRNEGSAPPKPAKVKNGLRRGKWTPEEEAYANRLIQEFKSGLLPLTDGACAGLSQELHCVCLAMGRDGIEAFG